MNIGSKLLKTAAYGQNSQEK